MSTLPDTGSRTEYTTGAVRDASQGKGHFHSIPPSALRRIARRFEDGAKKYSKNNWMKGIPLSHYYDSITRHTLAWAEGDTSEDHIGAILWNAAAMDWTEQEVIDGRLPAELDDLPYRKRKAETLEQIAARLLKARSETAFEMPPELRPHNTFWTSGNQVGLKCDQRGDHEA